MTVPMFAAYQEETTSDDYLTPSWMFETLGVRFDLDVAASPLGGYVPADRQFTKAEDGLAQPWEGRVWMNPPFSESRLWVRRFAQHTTGIALLPMARSNWLNDIWDSGDPLTLLPKIGSFVFEGGTVSYGCFLWGRGAWALEPLRRIGRVR